MSNSEAAAEIGIGADRSRTRVAVAVDHVVGNIRQSGRAPYRVLAGFFGAWALFFAILYLLPKPAELSVEGHRVLAIVAWASIMWVCEAMPVGITGVSVPLLLMLTHAVPWKDNKPPMDVAFSGFTSETMWLCLFSFIVAALMQLLRLDRRIALLILDKLKASSVGRVIWGFFGVNVVLAFFMPAANARSATLLPIVNGVVELLGDSQREREAKKAIVIQTLVYGAMICGIFIMTAHLPNMILIDLFAKSGRSINFMQWMRLQFPYLGMFVLTQWWVRHHFKTAGVEIDGGHANIHKMHADMGKMTAGEWVLLILFTAIAMVFAMGRGSPIYQLHTFDLSIIGLMGLVVLFIPGLFPFKWQQVQERTMWGTLLLLGGALTLTSATNKSGLANWLADNIHGIVTGQPWWAAILIIMIGTHVIRLGMLSNVAAIALFAPVLFAMASKLNLHPVAFTLLTCDTDTFAYILPTQITAAVIAYGSGTFSTADYAKVGWVSVLIGIAYGLLVMVPWYAYLGLPVWDPNAPWPF
jgi:sodium-dependent dicarboxylate transporter 2/3/5